ncbi:MAG: hypothetical protein ACLPSM_16680 [Acidimicrobiales bacterium]
MATAFLGVGDRATRPGACHRIIIAEGAPLVLHHRLRTIRPAV